MLNKRLLLVMILFIPMLAGCGTAAGNAKPGSDGPLKVLAVESFLADIAQNVAGDRVKVETLVPLGLDPHEFEPAPSDIGRVAASQALIVNGTGLEGWLQKTLDNAGGQRTVIEASTGLQSRVDTEIPSAGGSSDPHFWLDPVSVIHYVENIRNGLAQADPAGKTIYTQNAAAYIQKVKDLDAWIAAQVAQLPVENRLLVTNHESLGYFADRYGFRIVGAVLPSVTTDASPSAQQLAGLVQKIRSSGAKAIFLETGSNPDLANQIAAETGVRVVTDIYTHSLSKPDGPAATYLDMMRYNVTTILEALK